MKTQRRGKGQAQPDARSDEHCGWVFMGKRGVITHETIDKAVNTYGCLLYFEEGGNLTEPNNGACGFPAFDGVGRLERV